MSQLSVNNLSLALAFALVLVAVYISNREKLGLTKDIFYSISRAIVQLVIVVSRAIKNCTEMAI